MTKSEQYMEMEARYGAHNYHPLPVVLAKGQGPYPTVKKLASGGTNAMGEVGTLIALNALQGNLLKSLCFPEFPRTFRK